MWLSAVPWYDRCCICCAANRWESQRETNSASLELCRLQGSIWHWREALWKCLRSIGVDKVMVDLIESMYKQTKCSVSVNGKITEWFKVVTGVRQGCLLSPSLFNLFLEFVMKDLQNLDSGIQMGDMRINNIRYADDTTLMDLVFEKLQISTNELENACSRWGMKINPSKCKIMLQDERHI